MLCRIRLLEIGQSHNLKSNSISNNNNDSKNSKNNITTNKAAFYFLNNNLKQNKNNNNNNNNNNDKTKFNLLNKTPVNSRNHSNVLGISTSIG